MRKVESYDELLMQMGTSTTSSIDLDADLMKRDVDLLTKRLKSMDRGLLEYIDSTLKLLDQNTILKFDGQTVR